MLKAVPLKNSDRLINLDAHIAYLLSTHKNTSFIRFAASFTVRLSLSNDGFTSQISNEIVFGCEVILRINCLTIFPERPNEEGALTPYASEALITSIQSVKII